jgi:hypothetical protein
MKNILNNKPLLALIILWTFLHLMLLLTTKEGNYSQVIDKSAFWPFTKLNYTNSYDISEFVFYVLGLIVLITIVSLLNINQNEK